MCAVIQSISYLTIASLDSTSCCMLTPVVICEAGDQNASILPYSENFSIDWFCSTSCSTTASHLIYLEGWKTAILTDVMNEWMYIFWLPKQWYIWYCSAQAEHPTIILENGNIWCQTLLQTIYRTCGWNRARELIFYICWQFASTTVTSSKNQ